MVEVLTTPIVSLEANEVFVFGSNATGFHGAGAAGLACRGDARNTWRYDPWFLAAMRAPVGSAERVGVWAVYGTARGFQRGRAGSSYAVQTVVRPGQRRSVPMRDIYRQLITLLKFARGRGELTFILTPLGEGHAGYSRAEMALVYKTLDERVGLPDNLRFVRPSDDGR